MKRVDEWLEEEKNKQLVNILKMVQNAKPSNSNFYNYEENKKFWDRMMVRHDKKLVLQALAGDEDARKDLLLECFGFKIK